MNILALATEDRLAHATLTLQPKACAFVEIANKACNARSQRNNWPLLTSHLKLIVLELTV